jgi:hypothetical protein
VLYLSKYRRYGYFFIGILKFLTKFSTPNYISCYQKTNIQDYKENLQYYYDSLVDDLVGILTLLSKIFQLESYFFDFNINILDW